MNTFLICAGCLLWSLKVFAQDISLDNIKYENNVNKRFHFLVVNTSDSVKVYYVSLETWNDSTGWEIVKGDVFNYTSSKKIGVYELTTAKPNNHFFQPKKIIGRDYLGKKYRLKLTFGSHLGSKTFAIYSPAFIFREQ